MAAGVPVHIIQRGHNRSPCFVTDEDRSFYLFHLGRNLGRFRCALHAYCLMTNHVHLLLTPETAESCARLIKQVGQLYSQYVNRTYRRTGGVWEGRFRSCLVQSEEYLLACYRYIELNPVRAGLVARPDEYLWSSFGENAKNCRSTGLLTPHAEYLRLGTTAGERRRSYNELFGSFSADDRVEEIRTATNGGYALGSKQFPKAVAQAIGRRVHKGKTGRPASSVQGSEQQGDLPLQS